MTVISGKNGLVNDIPCVRTWSIETSTDLAESITSATKGSRARDEGVTDWKGTFTTHGDAASRVPGVPPVLPGESFEFIGVVGGEAPTQTGVTCPENGAIVDSIDMSIDVEGGGIVEYTVNFSGNSVLTLDATDLDVADATVPQPLSGKNCKVQLATVTGDPADVDDVRTISMTITADNQEYASSSTGGAKRRVSGNVDLNFSFSVYTDDFSSLPGVNDVRRVLLFVDATHSWDIEWGIFSGQSDLQVDREGGTPVGATCNGSFTGFTYVTDTPMLGYIKTPADGAPTYWPPE